MTRQTNQAPTKTRWRVQGVSVQGYSHLRDGLECQDAYRHAFVPSADAYVLAIADGAGSRARSAEGATLAVGIAVDVFGGRLRSGAPRSPEAWRSLMSQGYDDVVSAYLAATARIGGDSAHFAATLTVVVLAHPWAGLVSIGDGFVIAGAEDESGAEQFHLLSFSGAGGEYVNETLFLSSASARTDVTVDCLYEPALTAVVLSTDGLAPVGIRRNGRGGRANQSFLEPVLDSLDEPTDIARLLLEDRISRLSADDKTLLMAVGT
jgi:hypothetical protein